MPTGIDYSKFDKIVDSSDEEDDTVIRSAEPSKPGGVNKPKTPDPGAYNTNTTTAKAGFVLRVPTRTRESLPMYINVCSALCVAEPMKASASNLDSLGATFPYQLGDPREDHDGTSPCYVVEAMYSSKTLQATSNKQVHEELIKAKERRMATGQPTRVQQTAGASTAQAAAMNVEQAQSSSVTTQPQPHKMSNAPPATPPSTNNAEQQTTRIRTADGLVK